MKNVGVSIEDDLVVDKMHLDDECEVFATKYYIYAQQYSTARGELDAAKDRLKSKEAERDLYWRRNCPTDLKATEATYSALLNDDGEVTSAREALQIAQHAVDTLWGIMSSLDNQKSMLDNLVKLQISSYYSGDIGMSVQSARDRLNDKR